MLMYTGVQRGRDADGFIRDIQTQCIAIGDGVDYDKCELNPVLTGKDLPEGGSTVPKPAAVIGLSPHSRPVLHPGNHNAPPVLCKQRLGGVEVQAVINSLHELPDKPFPVRAVFSDEAHRAIARVELQPHGLHLLPGVQGRTLDMTVTVRPIGKDSYRWFRIRVAKDGEHETIIRYRPDQGTVKIDRTRSGLPHDIVHTRSFFVRPRDGEIKLRLVLDRFSLEVFVNDGEKASPPRWPNSASRPPSPAAHQGSAASGAHRSPGHSRSPGHFAG